MVTQHACEVAPEQAGQRLDKYLCEALPHLSRSRVQQLIEEGCITPAKGSSYKVKAGETFALIEPAVKALDLTPANIALDIIYEDSDLLVINKPPGMTVHPAPGAGQQTLVHALLAHCGDSLSGIGGVARPGIVHRIDKDTSGLIVVAKNDAAHHSLSAQLKSRELKRTYLAFCWGSPTPREGIIDAPLGRNPRQRKQMAVVENGKHAVTHYAVEALYRARGSIAPLASKVTCQLDTGRTHQIRVHMAHAKAALIGDPTYGIAIGTRLNRLKSSGTVLPEETVLLLRGFHRQALHAQKLALIHPVSGEAMEFFAPIPADLQTLEQGLAALTNNA